MSKTTISASATGLPSRRLFLAAGSAAAVLGALSTAARAEQADAKLIEAARAGIAAEEEYAALCWKDEDSPLLSVLNDRQSDQTLLAASLPATTREGLRAKAELLRSSLPKGFKRDDLADLAEDHEKLAWSLVADVLAL
ncbi:hypothetical protein [Rhodoblastus sp.]|jgi:hypothetical protein|uniref:hypothetical protein n=1 Tax=Rhodoblastus sp. TaxID=1962975 RepID=UPI0025ED2AF5|nr:hypothetical protein [Rhodoblastus sp.]